MKLLLSLFILLSGLSYASTVTVVASERCPYTCATTPDEKGFLVDIATYIFNQAGYDVDYTVSDSHDKAIEDVRMHKYDAIIGTDPKEAPDFIFPKVPLAYSYDVLIVPKYSKWKYTTPSSLDSLLLGLEDGRLYNDAINRHIEINRNDPEKIDLINGSYILKHNLKKLRFEKISATVEDRAVLRHFYFEKKKPFAFKVAHTYHTKSIYIAFSPKNYKSKQYAEIFYKWYQTIKGTQELKNILQKYGLTEAYIRPLSSIK